MNTKQLLLSFLFSLTMLTTQAQIAATQAGIAVQGIVRDNNNTAITSGEPMTIIWTIYQKDGNETTLDSGTKNVTPDSFGVFSFVMDVEYTKNPDFANNIMWLKLETRQGNNEIVISDEKLKHVPYAISANNGVPMGSIMAYLGSTPPPGWIILNGQSWGTVGAPGNSLKTFLGNPSRVPNLQGRFLKGVGTSVENNVVPIILNKPQNQSQSLKSHTHNKGTLGANNNKAIPNNRNVPISTTWSRYGIKNGETSGTYGVLPRETTSGLENDDTNHNHTISGNTGSTGNTDEVRPSSWGVNYIIKL
jgi:hypothetical protein